VAKGGLIVSGLDIFVLEVGMLRHDCYLLGVQAPKPSIVPRSHCTGTQLQIRWTIHTKALQPNSSNPNM